MIDKDKFEAIVYRISVMFKLFLEQNSDFIKSNSKNGFTYTSEEGYKEIVISFNFKEDVTDLQSSYDIRLTNHNEEGDKFTCFCTEGDEVHLDLEGLPNFVLKSLEKSLEHAIDKKQDAA